ncbi:MAG TPA: Clp protease N-terminal domain-containing protein [Mycobacteriales bacterium]|nr:Clp protease N-terminal domain-containing protein [Mycobacteriales bacterium]
MNAGKRYSLGSTYAAARDEAKRRGDRRISTEHFVLALLADPDSNASKILGRDLQAARRALDELDHEALRAVGVDAAPERFEVTNPQRGRVPVTAAVKAVLGESIRHAGSRRRLQPKYVLLALLERERPDPAAALFASLDIDPHVIAKRLRVA